MSRPLHYDIWRLAVNEWIDEVTSDAQDARAVEVRTEELFDAAPLVVLLAILAK